MIPVFLLNLAGRFGTTGKVQKALATALGIAGAALILGAFAWAFWRGLGWYVDRREGEAAKTAVMLDRSEIQAVAEQRNREAYEAADANMAVTIERDQTNDREVRDAAHQADNSSVGPGTRAVLERLRRQQQAGQR